MIWLVSRGRGLWRPIIAVALLCRSHLVEAVLEEVENAIEDEDCEIDRMQEIEEEKLEDVSAECSACQEGGSFPTLTDVPAPF